MILASWRRLDAALLRLDRVAAGRQAGQYARLHRSPELARAFRRLLVLLTAGAICAGAGVVTAVTLWSEQRTVGELTWLRAVGLSMICGSLLYFLHRATQGYRWAFERLRLFSRVFPVVALVVASAPLSLPVWSRAEQVVLGALLLGVARVLASPVLRSSFRRHDPSP